MKIIINETEAADETEIIVNCRHVDEQILRICAGLRMFDKKVTGFSDGQTFLLNASDIFYIETVDRKTFLYAAEKVYETPLKLYELEERLSGDDFIRATKSSLLNFGRVASLRQDLGGRMLCALENGETVVVSRQYAAAIKQKSKIRCIKRRFDMKKFMEAVMEWKTAACLMFTGCVILCAIITLFAGESAVSINTLASMLIVSALGSLLQMLAFTERIIKKLRYSARMLMFAVPFLAVLALNAYLFRWFPQESGYWLTFTMIFIAVFAGMSIGFEIYYRVMGKKYDGLLGQYRKQREE